MVGKRGVTMHVPTDGSMHRCDRVYTASDRTGIRVDACARSQRAISKKSWLVLPFFDLMLRNVDQYGACAGGVCVCIVGVREEERERVCVCVCACE